MEYQRNIYEQLDKDAMQILIDYGMCNIPIDVFKLASKLNMKLIKFSTLTLEQRQTFEGQQCVSIKISKSKYDYEVRTYYDDSVSINRQRFNIAHEIKHVLYEEWEYDDEKERHANHFARSLLLHPAILICLENFDMSTISNVFQISEEAVSNALEAYDSRVQYYGKKLDNKEIKFIKEFSNKTLFDNNILKINKIIK